MIRHILTFTVTLILALTTTAQTRLDSALYNRYDNLFGLAGPDSVAAFHQISEEMKEEARKSGDMERYYDLLINEISYEASRGNYTLALRKANEIMDDIQNEKNVGPEYYGHVYKSLGSIFEHRGNYQMASHYYERALRYLEAAEHPSLTTEHRNLIANLYSGVARVNIFYALDKAWLWNEMLGHKFGDDPHFRKPYLAHKARIYFYKHQTDSFLSVKRQYDQFIASQNAPHYRYGEQKLNIMDYAVTGNPELALKLIDSLVIANPMNLNAAMRIHDAMGRKDLALNDAYRWVHLQDSLNNELINEHLNELNVMLGTDKVQREAAREREKWMLGVVVLLILVVIMLVVRHVTRLRHMREIEVKNLQLERALDEAKESERMKTAFVQHVSHEMRTPLNIITGNAQIIANPAFELEEGDRKELLHGINEHTIAITNIVNDLLEVSLTTAKGRYTRDDIINVNEMGQLVLAEKEEKNAGRLKLEFKSELPDDCTIKSNYGGVERILVHLIGNALKFTEQGSVTLTASPSTRPGFIEYAVADTGIGVAPEFQEQIFEHFYKVDQFKQGMGIGLSMARKVAVGLGGTLTIDPTYTGGARFVLCLPIGM